ncbi:VQ motif-containing protein 31-like [Tripterygium wilfordii]|uniref:VQ motif-containing protein 31-like n=1 Tax=Tripterygium wilfordii TaxID=458696 RepID=UPI0018F82DEE|nr:VQ motif-containing protein 31-like [Tripterygium wilfordii]
MFMEKQTIQEAGSCKPLTTFVQTDTVAFREVVQRLTGPSEGDAAQGAVTKATGIKRQTTKLHERRQYMRPKLEIVKPPVNFKPSSSPSISGIAGFLPSPVGTPSTIFSKLSIQEEENKLESAIPNLNGEEEEKAIKERRFYLHPSPRSRPGYTEPELLPLFPLTSPKTSDKR